MSASNPFRRAQVEDNGSAQPSTSKIRSRKKAKRVQIISPHGSPTDEFKPVPRRISDGGTGSPPPERNPDDIDDSSSEAGSAAAEDEDLNRAIENTRRNSGSDPLSPPIPPSSTSSSSREPSKNPFAKGTAGAAPFVSFGLSTTRTRTNLDIDDEDQGPRGERQSGGSGGPAIDVDAFKNMLLTGKASAVPSAATEPHHRALEGTGDRNTDTESSFSKHLLFESAQGLMPESPRTSFDEHSASGSGSDDHFTDDDDDHDRSILMGAGRSEDIAPALPPKQQNIRQRKGPQTVSFADFEETIPPPNYDPASPLSPKPDPAFWINRPPLERQGSDLNKPLPPPPLPNSPTFSQSQEAEIGATKQGVSSSGLVVSSEVHRNNKKAAPPPPPVSRRHGQSGAVSSSPQPPTSRAGTRSSPSLNSIDMEPGDMSANATLPVEKNSKSSVVAAAAPPPPPPPSRRQQHTAAGAPESPQLQPTMQLPSDAAQHRSSPSPMTQANSALKPMPPPPPRRSPSSAKPRGKIDRTPSNSSRGSIPRNESPSGPSLSAAPAPPPPRRGAGTGHMAAPSSRNSLDKTNRRASGQSFGSYQSQRSGSVSSLQNHQRDEDLGAAVDAKNKVAGNELPNDILADMTAFQKEIDDLRARALGNA